MLICKTIYGSRYNHTILYEKIITLASKMSPDEDWVPSQQ